MKYRNEGEDIGYRHLKCTQMIIYIRYITITIMFVRVLIIYILVIIMERFRESNIHEI